MSTAGSIGLAASLAASPPPVLTCTLASARPCLQRASADEREELLSGEVGDLQRRCAEAEARQQEAAARIPEATQPLMRQLEAMQAAAAEQAAAWRGAEAGLLERLRGAEGAATAAQAQAAAQGRELEEARQQLEEATEQVGALLWVSVLPGSDCMHVVLGMSKSCCHMHVCKVSPHAS